MHSIPREPQSFGPKSPGWLGKPRSEPLGLPPDRVHRRLRLLVIPAANQFVPQPAVGGISMSIPRKLASLGVAAAIVGAGLVATSAPAEGEMGQHRRTGNRLRPGPVLPGRAERGVRRHAGSRRDVPGAGTAPERLHLRLRLRPHQPARLGAGRLVLPAEGPLRPVAPCPPPAALLARPAVSGFRALTGARRAGPLAPGGGASAPGAGGALGPRAGGVLGPWRRWRFMRICPS